MDTPIRTLRCCEADAQEGASDRAIPGGLLRGALTRVPEDAEEIPAHRAVKIDFFVLERTRRARDVGVGQALRPCWAALRRTGVPVGEERFDRSGVPLRLRLGAPLGLPCPIGTLRFLGDRLGRFCGF